MKKEFFFHLQSLRGFAASIVVLHHLKSLSPYLSQNIFMSNSELAVDFFFVLSGFVISLNYGSVLNDFNTIRESNKIIIGISTFSWWAAILSNAKEVYASKNWKHLKGNRNKNLPFVELENWKALDF